MSVLTFKCETERKDEIKSKVWDIVKGHYLSSVFPNTHIKYDHEGDDVYAQRMEDLMKASLCKFEDVEEGFKFEFDSTEDAGFEIAGAVYGTGMGYSDDGLTFLQPVFDAFIEQMPDVPFEGDCECFDKWVSDEYHCSYDGETFECDSEWMDEC